MTHENHRPLLLGDDALGRGHIVGERSRRILHDANAVAVLAQDPVDALPTRTIDESAVHQNNRRSRMRSIHDRSPRSLSGSFPVLGAIGRKLMVFFSPGSYKY